MAEETTDPAFTDALVQLAFSVQSILGKAAAENDLTLPQVRLLGILRDREPGMLELARHLGLDKSSVTGLVDRAERRGLVRRIADSDDGRAVRVTVTPAGSRLTDTAATDINNAVQQLGAALTAADRRTLTRLIGRIVSGLG